MNFLELVELKIYLGMINLIDSIKLQAPFISKFFILPRDYKKLN
jgi:hypothetical protein